MATSEMVTSYAAFIQDRWAGNGTTPLPADAVFDKATTVVNAIGAAPAWTVPVAEDFHGEMINYPYTLDQLRTFNALNIDEVMDGYWNDANTDLIGAGIEAHESEVYDQWQKTDPAATQANVDLAVRTFIVDELDTLEDQLFPAAQGKFLTGNMVFTSMYGEFIFGAYKKVMNTSQKLRMDLTMTQTDRASARLQDMLKIIITRGAQYAQMRTDLMYKKTQFLMQFAELRTKLTATTNTMIMADAVNAQKAQYAVDISTERWDADNLKYRFDAFAALHGGTSTSRSSTTDGWDAMNGFQKTVAIAGAAVSLGQGIAALGKDLSWWGNGASSGTSSALKSIL